MSVFRLFETVLRVPGSGRGVKGRKPGQRDELSLPANSVYAYSRGEGTYNSVSGIKSSQRSRRPKIGCLALTISPNHSMFSDRRKCVGRDDGTAVVIEIEVIVVLVVLSPPETSMKLLKRPFNSSSSLLDSSTELLPYPIVCEERAVYCE